MKDILLKIIEVLFPQWWFWLGIGVLIVAIFGIFNVDQLKELAEAAGNIIGKLKGQ